MKTDDRFGSARLDVETSRHHFSQAGFDRTSSSWRVSSARPPRHPDHTRPGRQRPQLAYVACFLDADVLEKWTDVAGMMTADPRMVPTARVIAN